MYRVLEWDSRFFGFRVARITEPVLVREALEAVLAELRRQGIVMAYWNVAADDAVSTRAANDSRGRLVEDKARYSMELACLEPLVNPRIEVFGETQPTPELECLALASGVLSRFNIDPDIPHAEFERLYRTWIRASVSGDFADVVLVAPDSRHGIIGMVTIVKKDDCGEIGLLAVDLNHRRQGVGEALVQAGQHWSAGHGCTISRVNTQMNNIPARSLYERCGYRLEKVEKVFHFWLKP